MTLPSFRRRAPAPSAAAAETFGRIPDWDGTTIAFGGVSGAGIPPQASPPGNGAPGPEETRPRRPYDEAIFVVTRAGFGLLCGMDLWRRHADPEAAHYRHSFDALRISALRAGWKIDNYGRFCCPRCAGDPAYSTPHPAVHWHPDVNRARTGPDSLDPVQFWLSRPATGYHADSVAAYIDGDPAAEYWFRVDAEQDMLCRTADGAQHGRHEAAAR